MSITRTINPIHFEDLEPHRFEDLIRQLIYDFKDWKSIEATGRLGSDDGIDILAIENYFVKTSDDEESEYFDEERVWIIQCKREQNISPKKVETIIRSDIGKQTEVPFGYILASSSNFSKKSRDIFKLTLNELGVKEFYIYGKAEIEDLLFQPKYDHLLFAYFGISLQKRKRSLKSNLMARLTTKRKLTKVIGGIGAIDYQTVFIKPSEQFDYPKIHDDKNLVWRFYETAVYQPGDCISVYAKKYLAYVNWETGEWDMIENLDLALRRYPNIWSLDEKFYDKYDRHHSEAYEKWNLVQPNNQAFHIELKAIHFDRIVLVDEIGDAYHQPPHIVVDYINGSPFENKSHILLRGTNPHNFLKPEEEKRIKYFK